MTLAYSEHGAEEIRTSTPEVKLDQNFFRNLQKFGKVQDLATEEIFVIKDLSLNNNTAILLNEDTGNSVRVDIQTLQENFRSSGFRLPENIVCSTCEATCKVLNPSSFIKESGKNDIVTYEGEPWIIVDCEKDFYWIRNVMDHTRTEKVRKTEVTSGGGYGDVMPKVAPQLSSVIADKVDNLSAGDRARVERITGDLAGKTLRNIKALELPSA